MSDSAAARVDGLPLPLFAVGSEALPVDTEFARLYAATLPRIYAFVRPQVASVATAEELIGRVFLKAYRQRDKFPEGDAALVWLFRIARTTLIDYWRGEGRRERASVPIDEVGDLAAGDDRDPEAVYAAKQRAAALVRVIGDLDPDDRMLVALRFGAQRTNREIAAVLDLSEAAVAMRLLRALRRLRRQLTDLGL